MLLYFMFFFLATTNCVEKRALQKSHEKPQWLKWSEAFLGEETLDQQAYMVKLLKRITTEHLLECTPVILYDEFTELHDNLILQKLLSGFPTPYFHGQIGSDYKTTMKKTLSTEKSCMSYMLFIKDVTKVIDIIGENTYNKIVIVAKSSQWRVIDFLSREESRHFVNLLVIVKSENVGNRFKVSACFTYIFLNSKYTGCQKEVKYVGRGTSFEAKTLPS